MRGALVLISHDRRFLQRLGRTTVWLSLGSTHRIDRDLAAFETWRDEHLDASAEAARKADRKLAAETEWLHKGVTARRKRNQGRLRALLELRQQRRERREHGGTAARLVQSEGETSGRLVIEAADIAKGYGGQSLVAGFSTRVLRGDRIGLIGPNGAGKTTLLNMLTGTLAPDAGRVRLGSNLQMVTLDQRRESLDPDWTLAQVLTDGSGDMVTVAGEKRHVIGYMKDFLFLPEQARTPVGVLSGGERARLMLARALARPPTCWCWTNRPTTWTWRPWTCCRSCWSTMSGRCCWSAMTATSWTVPSPPRSPGKGRGAGWNMPAATATCWRSPAAACSAARPGGEGKGRGTPKSGQATPAQGKLAHAKPAQERQSRAGLSFTEQHELKTLPRRMEALQAAISGHKAALDDPGLYHRDPEGFGRMAKALAEAEAELAMAEDRWLELELKRDQAIAGP